MAFRRSKILWLKVKRDLRELSRELAPLSEKIEDIQVEGITSNPPLPDYRPKRREAGTNIDDLK